MNNTATINKTSSTWKFYTLSTLFSGLGMWIIGGFYHNLILPAVDENIHPHHEGLGIVLIAYFILAFLMTYLYQLNSASPNSLIKGIKFGVIIGILWVFPHGLAMAATHETSVLYEIKNTLYHVIEQGIGGMIISLVFKYAKSRSSK